MRTVVITAMCLLAPVTVLGQGIGMAAHVGSLGIGADLAVSPSRHVGFRAGANVFPTDIDFSASDIDFSLDLPSPQFLVTLDVFPIGGGLRLSGGMRISADDVTLTGEFTEPVEIGDVTYSPSEVGRLTGGIQNRDVSPYLGVGWGNPARSRFGFLLDLGIAFQDPPAVTLAADGSLASTPQFQADLEAERGDIEEDLDLLKYYPVVSVGFSIGF